MQYTPTFFPGDVSERARRNPGRYRTGRIPESDGPPLQAALKMRQLPPLSGGRAGAVLLEQRVRHVSRLGEHDGDLARRLSQPLPQLQDALEQDHPRPHLQRAQAVYGDQPEAVRRMLSELQAGAATVR